MRLQIRNRWLGTLDPQTLDPQTLDPQVCATSDPKSVARDSRRPDSRAPDERVDTQSVWPEQSRKQMLGHLNVLRSTVPSAAGDLESGGLESRATDFGSRIVHSGSLESGGPESRATDFLWNRTYLGVESLGQPISDLDSYTLGI